MQYLGVDVAKHTHVAAVRREDGSPRGKAFEFSNDQAGFRSLLARMRELGCEAGDTLVVMESTGHYWLALWEFLDAHGLDVAVVNPVLTDAFRKADTLRKTKTDRIDAFLIAEYARFKRLGPSRVSPEFNTGFRVTELVELRASSFDFADGSCRVTTIGKGRKERSVPLWPETSHAVSRYMDEAGIVADGYLFPGRNVGHLTRSGARSRLASAFARASLANPALARKRCTPHTLRHSTAMAMLAAGIDLSTIAIWLGHESISTTHKYMVADMEMKERALERAASKNPFGDAPRSKRYVPEPGLLAFLESL